MDEVELKLRFMIFVVKYGVSHLLAPLLLVLFNKISHSHLHIFSHLLVKAVIKCKRTNCSREIRGNVRKTEK